MSGKVVDFIAITNAQQEWQELEIHFTDGTFLSFEIGMKLQLQVEYLKFQQGKLKRIKNYGAIPVSGEDEL